MIFRVTSIGQLDGPYKKELDSAFRDYLKRAKDPLSVSDLWELLSWHIENNEAFSFWLALDDKMRTQGFAMCRLIRDQGLPWEGDIWKVYIRPGAVGFVEEGLPVLEEWFKSMGVEKISFGTKRNAKAWERLLGRYGFKMDSVILAKELKDNGKPEGGNESR